MDNLLNKRALLVTGKGGVGRTSVSAGLALAGAKAGRRVLLVEIGEPEGDYSPLARLFGRERLPEKAEEIAPGVRGTILYMRNGHEAFLKTVVPIPALVRAAVRSKSLGRLLEAAPSFQEMGIFYLLLTLLKDTLSDGAPRNELLIFDMPATGHTLALTNLPDILLKLMPTGPIADALREGQTFFNDPELTAACVVTLPEMLPVTECLELIEGLRESGMPVGPIIVNKLPPGEFSAQESAALSAALEGRRVFGADRFMRLSHSKKSLQRLEQVDIPVLSIPEYPLEGRELSEELGDFLHRTQEGEP